MSFINSRKTLFGSDHIGSMEKIAAPSSPAITQQFQWLQTALSDLEEKMKAMMTLWEEDGQSSCEKSDFARSRKPELVEMLGQLNSSYRSLVEKFDQLRQSQNVAHFGISSLSSSSREIQQANNKRGVVEASHDCIWEASNSLSESVVDNPGFEHDTSSFECLNKLADDLILTEQCNVFFNRKPEQTNRVFSDEDDVVLTINGTQRVKPNAADQFRKGSSERENTWFQLKCQVTKLMEENLRQKAELLRRNDEKREIINGLRLQLEQLKSENRALQKCLFSSKTGLKRNCSLTSRTRGLFLGKFFGGC